jgi:biuret amidohydrolase
MSLWDRLGVEPPLMVRIFGGLPEWEIDLQKTALVIVDMQHYDALPGKGMWTLAGERGVERELAYYYERIQLVTKNLERVLTACRQQGVTVVHVNGDVENGRKIGDIKQNRTWGKFENARPFPIKRKQFPDDHEVVAPLRPLPSEIVVKKQGAGPFGITNMDQVLRQLGIELLIVGGTVTHQCVEMTIRGAFDYGYKVVMLEDGTATMSEELQRNCLIALGDWFCKVRTTDEVVDLVVGKGEKVLVPA